MAYISIVLMAMLMSAAWASDCNSLYTLYESECGQFNNWNPAVASHACKKLVYDYCLKGCTMLVPNPDAATCEAFSTYDAKKYCLIDASECKVAGSGSYAVCGNCVEFLHCMTRLGRSNSVHTCADFSGMWYDTVSMQCAKESIATNPCSHSKHVWV